MLYGVFRALTRTSLRWFYRDVTVVGGERVPARGPLLVAVNHPNALVDALVAVAVVPRRVTLTAKATLWENPALALLLPRVGIVPLRRAQDYAVARREPGAGGRAGDAAGGERVVAGGGDGAIVPSGGSPPRGGAAARSTDAAGDGSVPHDAALDATVHAGGPPLQRNDPPRHDSMAPPAARGASLHAGGPPPRRNDPARTEPVLQPAAIDATVPAGGAPLRENAPTGGEPATPSAASAASVDTGGPPPHENAPPRNEPVPLAGPGHPTLACVGSPPSPEAGGARPDNAAAFAALLDVLEQGGAVLIFPEGKSHSEPRLAPLKTGLARVALQARDERRVAGLQLLPVGLVFERKWQPRSRVLVQIGEPLVLDGWSPAGRSDGDAHAPPPNAAAALTAEVEARLRAVTLNFETARDEAQTLAVSRVLAAAFEGDQPLGRATTPLAAAVAVARRVEAARLRLAAGGTLPPRAAAFLDRLGELRRLARRHGVLLEDAEIATGLLPGARFTLREGMLGLLTAPVALWGAVNHLLPLPLAWTLGRRSSRNPDDPAMRTIVLGLALVLVAYALQTALVLWLAGPWWALLYLATLPPSAVVRLRWTDRARRALRRARTYRLFRREPALRERFAAELTWLRGEALALEGTEGRPAGGP